MALANVDRHSIVHRRRSMSTDDVATASTSVAAPALATIVDLISGRLDGSDLSVGSYAAIRGELDPRPLESGLVAALGCAVRLHLPVVGEPNDEAGGFRYAAFAPGDPLEPDQLGVPTPAGSSELRTPMSLDVVLVPLVAFSPTCDRLGWGAGWYDRTFAPLCGRRAVGRQVLVGLAHDFQEAALEPEPWDVRLDAVVTDRATHLAPHVARSDGGVGA